MIITYILLAVFLTGITIAFYKGSVQLLDKQWWVGSLIFVPFVCLVAFVMHMAIQQVSNRMDREAASVEIQKCVK